MLFRFCLYGFLKNQQYYDPFIILAFREKGLSFFVIGLLVSFRHICINILEIPTGIIADTWGRRKSMILSFIAYILSFIIYGFSKSLPALFIATFFFAIGEAFRTGTHKAMIFSWLQSQGKENEKTKYYGLTRSWSQIGSAVSVTIATAIVLITEKYTWIFWISVVPYLINIVNFLGYPSFLDGEVKKKISLRGLFTDLFSILVNSFRQQSLRRLFTESMIYKGNYTATKEYLQPLLKTIALGIPVFISYSVERRSAIIVGAVFFVLYLLTSEASRAAHKIGERFGGDTGASRILWIGQLFCFLVMIPSLALQINHIAVFAFVMISLMQNTYRPLIMSRLDECSKAKVGATILSIDSQVESIFVLITAPLLGLAVDTFGLWPVGVFGAFFAAITLALQTKWQCRKEVIGLQEPLESVNL